MRAAIANALHGFMQAFEQQGELQWDETHFRLARLPSGAAEADWVYRQGRKLLAVPAAPNVQQKEDCRKLLAQWMGELLDEMAKDGDAHVVALVSVNIRKKAWFQFSGDDAGALQVGLAYLGRHEFCLGGEFDVT